MADPASKESPIKAVQMESVTVMKVTRHCAANFPSVVSGFLVGMEVKGVLELTNAYPFPPLETVSNDMHHDSNSIANLAAAAPRAKASITYQNDMIKHLKEVNIDANNVGWYTSCNMGNFVNLNLIENQIFYQKDLNERTVSLIHDVSRSAQGAMSLRAFRLSPSFMAAFKEGKFTTESLQKSNLTYKDILIELPVQVHNSYLTNQFLYQLENPQTSSKQAPKLPTTLAEIKKAEKDYFKTPLLPNFASLDLSIDPFLEKSSELLLDSVETHYTELNNYQYYTRQLAREQAKITAWQQKRKAENMVRAASKQTPLPEDEWQRLFKLPQEPSRLETMLNSRQVEQYASQIDGFTATVSTKMFAVKENLAPGGDSKAS